MIYLSLFLNFLKVGAVSFGGGYGMIPLIREIVLSNGWLTEEAFLDFIAVAESTPGPIAVNMATFIGSTQGGILGAALATLGVILPAFVILLLVSMLFRNLLKYQSVNAIFSGIQPVVAGLITATAVTMMISLALNFKTLGDTVRFSLRPCLIFAVIALTAYGYGVITKKKKGKKKKLSPILLILLSAGLGILFYGTPLFAALS